MSDKSLIEWTDASWNFCRGCHKVSPGCKFCYAERFAERFRGVKGHAYERGFDPRFVPGALELPLRWTRPRKIFVNSMSDLYQQDITNEEIASGHGVMAAAPQHIFQVLTKRAERLPDWYRWVSTFRHAGPVQVCLHHAQNFCAHRTLRQTDPILARPWPLPNVWVGVSVESPPYLARIDHLRKIPAAVRFLSLEPLLADLGRLNLEGIHWVIAGGESGPGARPMEMDWVRSIRDQCAEAAVPFFFKQVGGILKKKTGRLLDGRTHDAFPAVAA